MGTYSVLTTWCLPAPASLAWKAGLYLVRAECLPAQFPAPLTHVFKTVSSVGVTCSRRIGQLALELIR